MASTPMEPIHFDPSLPINQRREEISQAISKHQVLILCGETGSGKTTQLPKICLSIGRGERQRIGHTQPRRIAARAVANRIAEELKSSIGGVVGFKIRFSDHSSKSSRIKLMTDGILLAEIQSDPLLKQYDTLIIDEAHERSLNIDFLLGYLKQLLPKRPDLKLIITSATIDPQRFSRHFSDAPVLEVSGRTYPVEVRYHPLDDDSDENEKKNGRDRSNRQNSSILEAIHELSREGPGDILIFFSGEREIREAGDFLRRSKLPQTEILPLFSRLSAKEQNRIFRAHSGRRIILSTNVAETSLTVPGIRYVVDTGTARISRYSHRSGIQRLPIEKISQAAADQRKGRCGRVSDGICIRLYGEDDFEARPLFTDAEILRTHLAPVILQMAALRLGTPDQFPFIDPPDLRLIRDGYRSLHELGAVHKNNQITNLGKKIARFPVDPQIARMLLAADRESSLKEILIIAAALTIQDPRERPLDAQQAADERHEPFQDEKSDFLFFINLWEFFQQQRNSLSNNQLRKLCKTNFLSWMRMREWREIHAQLRQISLEMGLTENTHPADYGMVHRALLTGLLSHIAMGGEKHLYSGPRGIQMHIWPGSSQFKSRLKWLVAAEKVETSQLYARTVARIEPEWIEQIGKHILKRSYAEPHWEKKRGQVAAFETVTIYGLPIVAHRKTNYGSIEPDECRKIFIRSALVAGELNTRGSFLKKNLGLINEVESLEAKSRRRDILVDEEVLYQFYDERIPARVHSTPTFEKWRKEAEKGDPNLLHLSQENLMQHEAESASDVEQFPDHLTIGRTKLPLSYHFEPESPEDGVTLTIPTELVKQLNPEQFEWLVPGLLRERVIAMIRALPKSWRRNFVPAPDFADAVMPSLSPAEGALGRQLSSRLRKITGVTLPEDIWKEITLPDHLRMRFQIIQADGSIYGTGRTLSQVKNGGSEKSSALKPDKITVTADQPSIQPHPLERNRIERWDFGRLPRSVEVERHGIIMTLYPALVADSRRISLKLLETEELAYTENINGVSLLFMLQQRSILNKIIKNKIDQQQLCLHYLALGECKSILYELQLITIRQALFADNDTIPTESDIFTQRSQQAIQLVPTILEESVALVKDILKRHHDLMRKLKGNIPPAHLMTYSRIKSHIEKLVYPGFLSVTPREWLQHIPRYLEASKRRLEKLEHNPQRDRKWEQSIAPLCDPFEKQLIQWGSLPSQTNETSPQHSEYRWLLEEYRVSIFAQELGTKKPVSADRLKKIWQTL